MPVGCKPKFMCLYTKDQLIVILSSMGITEPLPTSKKKALYISFPNGDLGKITISEHKSTYGKRLFQYAINNGEDT